MKKRIKRVLVVYKKSLLEKAKDHTDFQKIPSNIQNSLLKSDMENRASIHHIFYELIRLKIEFDLLSREQVKTDENYDLIIAVGGDGTFFKASHFVRKAPIMLVNSDPQRSLGLFACANRNTFAENFQACLDGKLHSIKLNRLQVYIGAQKIKEPVVNDILFSSKNPIAMTRYTLKIDSKQEQQDGSGVWVCTAAGSTAATHAAGGSIMPIESRLVQYVVREPYSFSKRRYKLLKGFARRSIEIVPISLDCAIWIDGSRTWYDVAPNQRVIIKTGSTPLTLLGYNESRRRKIFPAH